MITQPERQLWLDYARDAVSILRHSLQCISAGEVIYYRVAAVQLRLLFCDTTRRHDQMVTTALARRLWPELYLPAWSGPLSGGVLPLDEWLEQKLPDGGLSIRQFIRCVCDQDGGAHVDLRRHSRLPDRGVLIAWICRVSEIGLVAVESALAGER